jgi:hypothetical protein
MLMRFGIEHPKHRGTQLRLRCIPVPFMNATRLRRWMVQAAFAVERGKVPPTHRQRPLRHTENFGNLCPTQRESEAAIPVNPIEIEGDQIIVFAPIVILLPFGHALLPDFHVINKGILYGKSRVYTIRARMFDGGPF